MRLPHHGVRPGQTSASFRSMALRPDLGASSKLVEKDCPRTKTVADVAEARHSCGVKEQQRLRKELMRPAAAQHALLTRADAGAAGLSDDQISTRVAVGDWVRVYPGVYRLAGAPVTPEQRVLAAVLACGRRPWHRTSPRRGCGGCWTGLPTSLRSPSLVAPRRARCESPSTACRPSTQTACICGEACRAPIPSGRWSTWLPWCREPNSMTPSTVGWRRGW